MEHHPFPQMLTALQKLKKTKWGMITSTVWKIHVWKRMLHFQLEGDVIGLLGESDRCTALKAHTVPAERMRSQMLERGQREGQGSEMRALGSGNTLKNYKQMVRWQPIATEGIDSMLGVLLLPAFVYVCWDKQVKMLQSHKHHSYAISIVDTAYKMIKGCNFQHCNR